MIHSLLKSAPVCILLCASALALAQPAEENKPGIAIVKPQAWSQEGQATVLEFQGFSNRTGYVDFRTAKTPSYQVASARVVKIVVYPESPASISSATQRASLQKTIEDFAAIAQRFPSSGPALEKALAPLKSDAAKYDAGSVKEDGQWQPRATYFKQKAGALANLLRPELMASPKIKEFDLAGNQYYIGLLELQKSEPTVGAVVGGIQALYDSLVRKEDRNAILAKLNAPGTSYEQSMELLKQLKSLRPEEDSQAILFVQRWDTAVSKADAVTKAVTSAQTQTEACMSAFAETTSAPELTPALVTQIEQMSDAVKDFRAGSPPPVIVVPLHLADAMVAVADNLPVLAKHLAARQLLDAKSVLDSISPQSSLIGPKTSAVLAGLQRKLTADVEKFQALRNEGKMLAENDKIEEALKKYEGAYAIIPAKDVAEQIESLKKQ